MLLSAIKTHLSAKLNSRSNLESNSYSLATLLRNLSLVVVTSIGLLACGQAPDTEPDDNLSTAPVENTAPSEDTHLETAVSRETAQDSTDQKPSAATQIIEHPITILALGDSLTEGLGVPEDQAYPAQLQRTLKAAGYANVKVVNSGLSGETSTGLVNRLDWVLKTKPDITILTIGANDAMRGIDVATVEKNIRTAIERLQADGSVVVLGGMQIYDNLGNDYVQAFSDIYPKLAKDYDIAFIPFFLEGVGGVAELNQSDAIHPTAEGYRKIVSDNILPILEPTLENYVNAQADTAS